MPKLLKTGTAIVKIPEKVLNDKGKLIKSTTAQGNISKKSVLIQTAGEKVRVLDRGVYVEPPEKKKKETKPIVRKSKDTKKKDEAVNKIAGAFKAKKARNEMAEMKKGTELADEDKKYPNELYRGIRLIYKGDEIPPNKLQKMSKKKQIELIKKEWNYDDNNAILYYSISDDIRDNLDDFGYIRDKVNRYFEKEDTDKAYELIAKEVELISIEMRREGRKKFIDELIKNNFTSYENSGGIIKMKKYTFLY